MPATSDSTLDFELRCFVSGIQNFRFGRHDLNKAIDAAFPQRTLWVRDFKSPLTISQETDSPAEVKRNSAEDLPGRP